MNVRGEAGLTDKERDCKGASIHEGNEEEICIIVILGRKKFLIRDTSAQFLSLPKERRNI